MPPETPRSSRPQAQSASASSPTPATPVPLSAARQAPPTWRVILRREFRQLQASRWYMVATALGVFLILSLSFVPAILDYFARQQASHPEVLAVVGPDAGLAQQLQAATEAMPTTFRPNWRLVPADPRDLPELAQPVPAGASWESTRAQLDPLVKNRSLSGYVWVGQIKGEWQAKLTQRQLASAGVLQALLQPLAMSWRAQAAGLNPQQVASVVAPLPVQTRELEPLFSDRAKIFSQILSYFLLFVLYMAVLFYGQMIVTGIAQEKSSRVVELLVSAARPADILTGKILGIGLGGLLQFGIWTVVGVAVALVSGPLQQWLPFQARDLLAAIPVHILLYFLLFFLLGYWLYAVINAALGSMISRVEEAGSVSFPIIVLVLLAYSLASAAMVTPQSQLVVIGSLIPFFAPMVMFTRLTVSAVPAWQIALSAGLTVLLTVWLHGLASRLYHAHVLRFQRVSWKESWRELVHRPLP